VAYFNFKGLLQKYTRPFTVITKAEKTLNTAGDYVYGTSKEIELKGAIIGFAESKIHRSEGTLTEQDMALHMLEPIDNALIGAMVIFEGDKYRIEVQKGKNNAVFTGVYSYTLKYVSAFNGEGKNG
jgi:hypothetical protein